MTKEVIGIRQNKIWVYMVLVCLLLILMLSITIAVSLGPVPIPFKMVWKIALAQLPIIDNYIISDWSQAQKHIIWDIRFPRVLLGAIVGAGLAVVGVAMQTLVRNSLADPYILGVSSGASVGATLVILFGAFKLFDQYALSAAAFSGALLSIILVFLLAQVGGRIAPVKLLLSGIALSAVLNAVTSFIVMSAPREEGIRNALFWMMGSLAGAKWDYLTIPALAVIFGIVFLTLQARTLNAMLMGEETAGNLGVDTNLFNKSLLLITAILTGVIVAVSGAIGFVGLMIPHIVRVMVGSNHYRVLPVSAFIGAIFIIWSDVLARLVIAPEELPIGIITAICGGPFFIWLLQRSSYSFGDGQN